MNPLNLSNDILKLIFEYDPTYRLYFNKNILPEYMNLFEEYDTEFFRSQVISCNCYNNGNYLEQWIDEFGKNYDPIKYILKVLIPRDSIKNLVKN